MMLKNIYYVPYKNGGIAEKNRRAPHGKNTQSTQSTSVATGSQSCTYVADAICDM